MAASTVTMSIVNHKVFGETNIRELIFSCVADSAAATFLSGATSSKTGSTHNRTFTDQLRGWFLLKLIVDPGAIAPTVNSDLTFKEYGCDLLDGNGTDKIHNTDTKQVYPAIDGLPSLQPITDHLTLAITNNAVNSAIIVVRCMFVRTTM
ncbi:hypothetical protein LCGC14_1520740 [marine sediment metagenome]|uniref:Uncharacterized protein n=1 Tax=marine sediment metagenome TaxID=412755 RepID=A0A0F9LEC7_9ZZZZ